MQGQPHGADGPDQQATCEARRSCRIWDRMTSPRGDSDTRSICDRQIGLETFARLRGNRYRAAARKVDEDARSLRGRNTSVVHEEPVAESDRSPAHGQSTRADLDFSRVMYLVMEVDQQ